MERYDRDIVSYLRNFNQKNIFEFEREISRIEFFLGCKQEPKHEHLPSYDLFYLVKDFLESKEIDFTEKNIRNVNKDELLGFAEAYKSQKGD